MNLLVCTILWLISFQSQTIQINFADENMQAVEGVYAELVNASFLYSDKEGAIKIPDSYNLTDSIFISHLSFKTIRTTIAGLKVLPSFPRVLLESDIKELGEITISKLDEKKFVKEAIELIPSNYLPAYSSPYLSLNADISYSDAKDDKSLIKYTGELILSIGAKRELYVSKNNYAEHLAENLEDYVFEQKPYKFSSIIAITSHPVIRKFKDFEFYKHDYILYKDFEAVKIYFRLDRKHGGQSGYLIINLENKAIMSLNYQINPIKDWIAEKTRKGLLKTSLLRYFVEADYSEYSEGKYLFDSGRESINLSTKKGGETIGTKSDIYLKRKTNNSQPNNSIRLKDIFAK